MYIYIFYSKLFVYVCNLYVVYFIKILINRLSKRGNPKEILNFPDDSDAIYDLCNFPTRESLLSAQIRLLDWKRQEVSIAEVWVSV